MVDSRGRQVELERQRRARRRDGAWRRADTLRSDLDHAVLDRHAEALPGEGELRAVGIALVGLFAAPAKPTSKPVA